MGNLIKKFCCWVWILLLPACGVKMGYLIKDHQGPPAFSGGPLSNNLLPQYQIKTIEGKELTLFSQENVPTLLIFGQDTCETCAEETEDILKTLSGTSPSPSKIIFLSILIGSTLEDALDWKHTFRIPWTVAYEEESKIFQSFCPKLTVPCIVIAHPQKGILFQGQGRIPISKMQEFTGPWE